MYEAQLEKDWKFIVDDSGSKALIVSNESIHAKVKSMVQEHKVVVMDCNNNNSDRHSFHRLLQTAQEQEALKGLKSSDIATCELLSLLLF